MQSGKIENKRWLY